MADHTHDEQRAFESFEDFWPYYLREHGDETNRTLHVAGTSAALGLLAAALWKRDSKLALLAPLVGYGSAWVGHFLIEGNRPATFEHPLWSLRGDLRMLKRTLTGEIERDLSMLDVVDGEILSAEVR